VQYGLAIVLIVANNGMFGTSACTGARLPGPGAGDEPRLTRLRRVGALVRRGRFHVTRTETFCLVLKRALWLARAEPYRAPSSIPRRSHRWQTFV